MSSMAAWEARPRRNASSVPHICRSRGKWAHKGAAKPALAPLPPLPQRCASMRTTWVAGAACLRWMAVHSPV